MQRYFTEMLSSMNTVEIILETSVRTSLDRLVREPG